MLSLFKNLSKKDWIRVIIGVIFVSIQVWLDLKMPDYMAEITKLVQMPGSVMADILSAGGKMLLCALGSLAASIIVAIFAAKIGTNFAAVLRLKMFNKVEDFSMEEIGKFSTASLITRSTNDVTQVQMFITMGLQVLVKSPIMAVWAICKISNKSWQWTLSTAIAVFVLLIIVGTCVLIAMPKFKKLQVLNDDVNRVTRENIIGLRVVRAYNAEDYQEKKFDVVNQDLTHTHLFTARTMSFMMPGIQLVMNGLALAIYWVGAIIINDALPMERIGLFSDMVVFTSYAIQIVMSFMMLVMIFIILPRASVSAKRINEVIKTKTTIKDGILENAIGDGTGNIEFRNVSFKYPDAEEYVLENINFTAKKGEMVAFIGSTGCGKSTIINLIPRFYDATDGEILINGINIREYKQTDLRNKIGYVSQKAILFGGTVQSNITYGNNGTGNYTKEQVEASAITAQASEFIEKMEDGYDSYIAQSGSNLSGGQKQRISIARAICRNPEIFIFDDSFSALDYKTDKELRKELMKKCANATKLIVAQRIGTIRDADKIVVLDDGKIAGIGTHKELMKQCEVYKQIAYSQLSKEELE